jgi:uncharacterized Zn finger protein
MNKADVKSIKTEKAKCNQCKADYSFEVLTGKDGTIESRQPKHGRCDKCQTLHLVNGRVKKFMVACEHIGNLKLRLIKHFGEEGRDAVIAQCEQSMSDQILSRLTGDVIVASGFDLAKLAK